MANFEHSWTIRFALRIINKALCPLSSKSDPTSQFSIAQMENIHNAYMGTHTGKMKNVSHACVVRSMENVFFSSHTHVFKYKYNYTNP